MNCPFCKISSMRTVKAGDHDVDRCMTCGALWFDAGEIRELTEGRVPLPDEPQAPGEGGAAADSPSPASVPGARGPGPRSLLFKMHREAAKLSCPRCGGTLAAIDFQVTGVPLFLCVGCQGYLAPRGSAAAINARFRYVRDHADRYAALGEAMAEEFRRGMRSRGEAVPRGPHSPAELPLPILVPLGDDAPPLQSVPFVTYFLIALSAVLYFYFQIAGAFPRLPGGVPGIPSGGGLGAVPAAAILASPFVHGGLLPLLAGSLFLFVLGDDVEDRVGRVPYVGLYLLCGAAAGVAQLLWGHPGHPPALGSAGAVAGILGAYLIFFPQVSITMYGLGRLASVPAYLFACAWIVAAFLIGPGPFASFFNPAPFSFAGNVAGFAAGVFCAVFWRYLEDTTLAPATRG